MTNKETRVGPTIAELKALLDDALAHPENCIDVTDMTRAERNRLFFGIELDAEPTANEG